LNDPLADAIAQTRAALLDNASSRWIIGFSGGKDSTALLKVIVAAADGLHGGPQTIEIIYCDTGVENPALDLYVKNLLGQIDKEICGPKRRFRTVLLKAPVKDRFFVKLIGRGYPPPTNTFRWCTKNLRINPVSRFIAGAAASDAVVALGMRRSESRQRDRSLKRTGDSVWQRQVEGKHHYRLFLPSLSFDTTEFWDTIFELKEPRSIDAYELARLYRGASGECPIIKSPDAPPCATGRFGCWTCTVVRKDRSTQRLIEAGHVELAAYLEFRNWLIETRNDPDRRWPLRRNGTIGLGPFTLKARADILSRLLD
jgi:DNA sulfur modification protein DndC